MSNATDLKPCPFCGGNNLRVFRHLSLQFEPCVLCRDCSAIAVSVAEWNRRADLQAERDALLAAHKPTEAALVEVAREARRKALEEAIEACLTERGDPPKVSFMGEAEEGWFDGAQSCADAIRAMMTE